MGAPGLELPRLVGKLAARELQDPAASRALRATALFMVPLVLAALGLINGTQAVLAAFAGHAAAGLDVRGAYALRLSLLAGLSLVFTGAAWMGALAGPSLPLAVAATGLVALGAGAWRHGLGEYGPAVAGTSALLFFIALGSPRTEATPFLAARATLAGNATLVVNMGPLVMPFLAWSFLREVPTKREIAGTGIALVGMIVLAWGDYRFSPEHLVGDGICFLSMLVYSVYIMSARVRRTRPSVPSPGTTCKRATPSTSTIRAHRTTRNSWFLARGQPHSGFA